MLGIISVVIGLAGLGLIFGFGIKWQSERDSQGNKQPASRGLRPGAIFLGFLIFIIFAIAVPMGVKTIPAGERGVVLLFGAVTDRTLDEGLNFIVPIANSVEQMTVQTVAYETPAAAASKDLQVVSTTVVLNYSLEPSRVNRVYQELRKDYEIRIVAPAIQEAVKATTALFPAEELITRRPDVKAAVEDRVRTRLMEKGMKLDTLQLTDFTFSDSFNASIEAKVQAEQSALQSINFLEQVKTEAKQAEERALGEQKAAINVAEGQKQSNILAAQGDAEAIELRAQGEAKAITLRADAQAGANDVIALSLTADVITYEAVQRIAPGVNTIVLPPGQEFIFGEGFLGRK